MNYICSFVNPTEGIYDFVATLQTFSALCWLYGKQLNEHRGYPIGLVESNWGGTPIEAWSSTRALAKCSQHGAQGRKRFINFISYTYNFNNAPVISIKPSCQDAFMYIYNGIHWYDLIDEFIYLIFQYLQSPIKQVHTNFINIAPTRYKI